MHTPILVSALIFSVLQNLYLATLMSSDRNDTHFLGNLVPVIQILTISFFF